MSDDPLAWGDDRLLTRAHACVYARALGLRLQPATLAKYASKGGGPEITYFGARPYYKLADLRAWLVSRLRKASSTARPRVRKSAAPKPNPKPKPPTGEK